MKLLGCDVPVLIRQPLQGWSGTYINWNKNIKPTLYTIDEAHLLVVFSVSVNLANLCLMAKALRSPRSSQLA